MNGLNGTGVYNPYAELMKGFISIDTATLLYVNGVALKDIQDWLGHSDISATSNTYTHLDFSSKVVSAEAIMPYYPK